MPDGIVSALCCLFYCLVMFPPVLFCTLVIPNIYLRRKHFGESCDKMFCHLGLVAGARRGRIYVVLPQLSDLSAGAAHVRHVQHRFVTPSAMYAVVLALAVYMCSCKCHCGARLHSHHGQSRLSIALLEL